MAKSIEFVENDTWNNYFIVTKNACKGRSISEGSNILNEGHYGGGIENKDLTFWHWISSIVAISYDDY